MNLSILSKRYDGYREINLDQELKNIARRVNWFEPPEQLIADTDRFLLYFMQYCVDSDIKIMRNFFSNKQFRHALKNRPPGILDKKSIAYWELITSDN